MQQLLSPVIIFNKKCWTEKQWPELLSIALLQQGRQILGAKLGWEIACCHHLLLLFVASKSRIAENSLQQLNLAHNSLKQFFARKYHTSRKASRNCPVKSSSHESTTAWCFVLQRARPLAEYGTALPCYFLISFPSFEILPQ
jgi:hypothetical protein